MSRRSIPVIIACGLLCLTSRSNASDMVMCIEDQAASPYTFPNKDGTMQVLLKMAAKQAGVNLSFKVQAWKRCISDVQGNQLSGLVNAGYTPFHAEYAVFPMKSTGQVNTALSLARMDVMAYRVKQSKANWDGQVFSNLSKPVLMPSGFATISDKLKELKVDYDENTKEPLRNLYKMIAGQGDIVLGFSDEMQALIANRKDISDKVEQLPAKFMTADYFAPVSKKYYADNKDAVNALWDAVGKIKTSKEYLDAIKNIK